MSSAELLILIDAGSNMLARLVTAYLNAPDKVDEIAKQMELLKPELESTAILVAGWRPVEVPPPAPPQ